MGKLRKYIRKHYIGPILITICLFAVVGWFVRRAQAGEPATKPIPQAQTEPNNSMGQDIVQMIGDSQFQPSFEMRENVDFLMTPALVMQESLSSQSVITYPNE